jgi:bifunctional oligoribonuclease and PAP phosphatase NrnA
MSTYPPKLPFPEPLLQEVHDLLKNSRNVLIISHKGPDGDTIGANLALRHTLTSLGKSVTSACVDPPPEYAHVLKGVYSFVNNFELSDFDLVIVVDCGAHYLMEFHKEKPELLKGKIPLINIDHHPSNDFFGTHNIVNDKAAAASCITYHLLRHWGYPITHDIANCLMMGLYYDTGSFMHSNTTPLVMQTAADLMSYGARIKPLVKGMFKSTPASQLKLWGRVMQRARLTTRNAVVSAVTNQDFKECDAQPGDLSGVIDYLNSVPGSRFSILLSENHSGKIKGSLRTQNEDVDLSKIAGLFGGGGHKKAAGFSLPGKLEPEITWKIRPAQKQQQ